MTTLKETTHTPGPWTLEDDPIEPCRLIGNSTIHIADIYCTDFPVGSADARLIAAAPELLAALQGMESLLTRYMVVGKAQPEADRLLEYARNAIAKAVRG